MPYFTMFWYSDSSRMIFLLKFRGSHFEHIITRILVLIFIKLLSNYDIVICILFVIQKLPWNYCDYFSGYCNIPLY